MSASANRQTAATKGGSGTVPTPANNTDASGNRRRSSGTGGVLFNGLMNQKRNSTDTAATARRASFADQKPGGGFIGNLWNR
ncbi:MAG: hypothetical protein M1812_000528 [Candelaria pacifica]|nr:MAG: hypothetical protein M1812_000528 [Candelaria pacifica]